MDGYILVASGPTRYFEMAAAAARSIRYFDKSRGICLACDNPANLSPEDRGAFDHVVRLQHTDTRRGTEHHVYLDQLTPFDRTLYVDGDCLMSNPRIEEIWETLKPYKVTFPGRKLTEGVWRKGVDVGRLRELLDLDYVVQCNGGVFYFDRSIESRHFFGVAQDLFENRRFEISVRHVRGKGMANEPIWGCTMAITGQPIFPLSEHLNVSTMNVERWRVDGKPSIHLWKQGQEFDPVICHFLGLDGPKCPNDLYAAFQRALAEPGYTTEDTFTIPE